jgi:hypothetical protein
MTQDRGAKLIPFTILDAMILIAIVALDLHVFRHNPLRHHDLFPGGVEGWAMRAESVLQVPATAGPLVIMIQFFRGRTHGLLPGEVAWLACAIVPMLVYLGVGLATDWAIFEWVWPHYIFHPFVLVCAVVGIVGHFRVGRPKHWSHRLGLVMLLALFVPAVFRIVLWFF